jgi:hypothetical protein
MHPHTTAARPLARQVAYNLIYSLGQHSYDADCSLFLRVFLGDVEESVREEQAALEQEVGWGGAGGGRRELGRAGRGRRRVPCVRVMLFAAGRWPAIWLCCSCVRILPPHAPAGAPQKVLAALRLVDTSINQRPTGWLHKSDAKTALAGFFRGTGKTVDRLDEVSASSASSGGCGQRPPARPPAPPAPLCPSPGSPLPLTPSRTPCLPLPRPAPPRPPGV